MSLATPQTTETNIMAPPKKRVKSDVWEFFDKIDSKSANCKSCFKQFSSSGNTTNLWHHLKRFHQQLIIEKQRELKLELPPQNPEMLYYQCSACESRFMDQLSAEKHLDTHKVVRGRVFDGNFLTSDIPGKVENQEEVVTAEMHAVLLATAAIPTESQPNHEAEQPENQDSEMSSSSGGYAMKWTKEMVEALVECYKSHEDEFANISYTPKRIWSVVAEEMDLKNFKVTGDQCNAKWRSLKKLYKKIKENNEKPEANRIRKWEHYSILDDVCRRDISTFNDSVEIEIPPFVVTGDMLSHEIEFEDFNGQSLNTEAGNLPKSLPDTEPEWFRNYREEKRQRHKEKGKRHEERMQFKMVAERNKNKFRVELLNVLKKTLQ